MKCYGYAFQRWKKWAKSYALQVVPANPVHVSIFLTSVLEENKSYHSARTIMYAIDWAHKVAGIEPPSHHPLVRNVVNAGHRILGKPTFKKEPITPELLRLLVSNQARKSLYNSRTLALCLLAFAGFLRFDELSNLKCFDIELNKDYMLVFIESSKTDQYRDGAWLPISRSNKDTCPVRNLENYAKFGDIDFTQPSYLFRGINYRNGRTVLNDTPMKYSRVREIVKEAFGDFIDPKLIGVHSLRAGGATTAANAGIPDRLFKRHGRWVSEKAKDGYIKDNLQKRLLVSQSLGI